MYLSYSNTYTLVPTITLIKMRKQRTYCRVDIEIQTLYIRAIRKLYGATEKKSKNEIVIVIF